MSQIRDRSTTSLISSTLPRPPLWSFRSGWGLICLVAIAASLYSTGIFTQEIVNPGGLPLVLHWLQAGLHPDLSREFLQLTIDAALVTLAYAVCGTSLSVLLGAIAGLLASEVWWQSVLPAKHFTQSRQSLHSWLSRWPWLSIRACLAIPRAIHEILWGLFFVNILGLDPIVAILAIAIPFGAITAKVFSEILDETPRQPLQALLNSGVAPFSAVLYGLLPQAFPNLLSYTFYRFECSIRSAAVLGIIGAGGLGYQLLLSLQSLRYEQMWTLFWALLLLNGGVDFWSALLRNRLGLPSRLDLNALKLGRWQLPRVRRDPVVLASIVGVMGLVPFSFWYVKADVAQLWQPRTWQLLSAVSQSAWPPHLSGLTLGPLGELTVQTLAMSVVAIAIAALGALLLAFPAARNLLLPGGLLNPAKSDRTSGFISMLLLFTARFILLVSRAIPAPIWALVCLFVLFPGILPGAIALGIHNLGILGRLMAEVIENLDQKPVQALKAQGAAAIPIFLYGILPPTLPRFFAYVLYRWEVCIRETVIVGLVGAGGLGRLLTEQLSSFDYPGLLITLSCFVAITFAVDLVSTTMRRSLR